MAKYSGMVGFSLQEQTSPGVWTPTITERHLRGDTLNDVASWRSSENRVNDNINIQQRISLMADPFTYKHYSDLVYITLDGVKWKVSTIEVKRPRLLVSLGGLYNGQ